MSFTTPSPKGSALKNPIKFRKNKRAMSAGFFDQAQAQFRKRRHLSYFYDNS